MDNVDLFDSLVKNSLDFFNKAITEIEDNPKYSVIHFFSAIEILLKARLLFEHWTLVYDDPQNANIQKFLQGDFKSVQSKEAIKRIKNIINFRISDETQKSFEQLQDHRNKLIHFFHPEFGHHATPSTIAKVVADECVAWFHLHKLLTEYWSKQFSKFDSDIYYLNRNMLKLRPYLKVKFESISQDIDKGKKRGIKFISCTSCGFEATIENDIIGPIKEKNCLVCEFVERSLTVPCHECNNAILVYELGEGECKNCGKTIDMKFLIDYFGDKKSPKDEMCSPSHAYCTNCEWFEEPTVVPWNESYFCLNCFNEYDSVEQCEWCSELNAGDMSNSYFRGCVICNGKGG